MKDIPVTMTRTERILGWIYWPLQLLVIPVALALVLPCIRPDLSDIQFNFIFFAINFVCLTAIMCRFLGKNAKIALQSPFRTLRYAFGGYIFFWVCTFVIGSITTRFMPDFFNVNDASIMEMAADDYTLTAIGTVLLAPMAEELMYRGLIFGQIYRRSPIWGYIVSSAVFAAIHVVGYIGLYDPLTLLLCFVQYIPAGLCLGWAYARSGTILAPILAHMAINQTSMLTMR